MNIALVCPDDLSIVQFCTVLVHTLQKYGSGNRVFVLSDFHEAGDGRHYEDVIRSWGAELRRVPYYRYVSVLGDLRYTWRLYKIFRDEEIDVVIAIASKPNIYGAIAARLAGVPTTVCSVFGLGTPFGDAVRFHIRIVKYAVVGLFWLAGRLCSRMWFTNPADREYLVSRGVVPSRKTFTSNFYVDTDLYAPDSVSASEKDEVRRALGLTSTDDVVLMVGRMIWAKGVKEFVEASKLVQAALPSAKFILVGPLEGDNPDAVPISYLNDANAQGSCRWIGFRRNVRALYAICDVAVLPTYYREGGFPRTLTEPMSMGKPLVTTDSAHCRGTVEHGRNGYLVAARDPAALAAAIGSILRNDEERVKFGVYSRVKAERDLSERIIIPQVVEQMFGTIRDPPSAVTPPGESGAVTVP